MTEWNLRVANIAAVVGTYSVVLLYIVFFNVYRVTLIAVCGDFIQNTCWGPVDHEREGAPYTLFKKCVFGERNMQLVTLACGVCINVRIGNKKSVK